MKIYNITKGQLVTVWLAGIFSLVWTFGKMQGCPYRLVKTCENKWFLITLLIALVLVFFTLGWRKHNKKSKKKDEPKAGDTI